MNCKEKEADLSTVFQTKAIENCAWHRIGSCWFPSQDAGNLDLERLRDCGVFR